MFKKLLMLCLVVVALACHQDENISANRPPATIEVRDGRLFFATELLYVDKLSEFEALSSNEQNAWVSQFRFTPLQSVLKNVKNINAFMDEQKLTNLGPGHLMFLNKDRLIQFGNDVVYFYDQSKYYMSVDEFNNLADKSEIMKSERVAKIIGQVIGQPGDNSKIAFSAYNNGNIGNGGNQSTFLGSGHNWKFVDEYYATTEQVGTTLTYCGDYTFDCKLYLRLKLEELDGGGHWYTPVGEEREYKFSVNYTKTILGYGIHNAPNCGYAGGQVPPPLCWGCDNAGFNGTISGDIITPDTPIIADKTFLIADSDLFNGDWHGTIDQMGWNGFVEGYIDQKHVSSGITSHFTF